MVLAEAIQQSVQELPDAKKQPGGDVLEWFSYPAWRGPILDRWGTRAREKQLRRIYRHDENTAVKGAFAGIAKKVAATAWQIRGPENVSGGTEKYYKEQLKFIGKREPVTNRSDIEYYQQLLRQADWGSGWTRFIKKLVLDYHRQDAGAFVEIIAPGSAKGDPTGTPTMLAVLDSVRVIPTGDPAFPGVYVDRKGKLHLIPHSRLFQMVDMPDTDEEHPGYGECALSRAAAIAERQVLTSQYIRGRLDDKPAPGIVIASNMKASERNAALQLYREDQARDEQPEWGKQLWLFGIDPQGTAAIQTVAFSQAPELFDFKVYTDIDINMLALALNMDVQDLWQLSGGNMGSGAQSEILHQKSKGKGLADLYSQIERLINDLLPEEYEFLFDQRDEQEDLTNAQIASTWVNTISAARNNLQDDEVRQLLANTSDEFHTVLTDDDGELITVDDLDVQPQEDVPDVEDEQEPPARPNEDDEDEKALDTGMGRRADAGLGERTKAFQATRDAFITNFTDLLRAAIAGDPPNRTFFGIKARGLLRRHGLEAFRDGLEEGGVQDRELSEDDFAMFLAWLAAHSPFVSAISQRIFKTEETVDPVRSAEMWANKSLQQAFDWGRLSADRNGMYEFFGKVVKKSCRHCKILKGQRHRLHHYIRTGWLPKSDRLDCGGFNCVDKLVRVEGKSRGRFPRG